MTTLRVDCNVVSQVEAWRVPSDELLSKHESGPNGRRAHSAVAPGRITPHLTGLEMGVGVTAGLEKGSFIV